MTSTPLPDERPPSLFSLDFAHFWVRFDWLLFITAHSFTTVKQRNCCLQLIFPRRPMKRSLWYAIQLICFAVVITRYTYLCGPLSVAVPSLSQYDLGITNQYYFALPNTTHFTQSDFQFFFFVTASPGEVLSLKHGVAVTYNFDTSHILLPHSWSMFYMYPLYLLARTPTPTVLISAGMSRGPGLFSHNYIIYIPINIILHILNFILFYLKALQLEVSATTSTPPIHPVGVFDLFS